MSTTKRDFSNFELSDNVFELAGGLIPELMDRFEIDYDSMTGETSLSGLVGKLGKNEVLRNNEPVQALTSTEMAVYLKQSGVQKSLNRSLWTPDISADGNLDGYVLTGAMANWQDRAANMLVTLRVKAPVYLYAGERVMDTGTETPNPNNAGFHKVFKRYPTESEYAATVIQRKVVAAGFDALPGTYHGTQGDALADDFFKRNEHLLEGRIAAVRVANAGVQLAVQLRQAARKLRPDFDSDPQSPQLFVITDEFPIAQNSDQEKKPAEFQKPQSGLRQVAVTAKSILETQNS